MLAFKPDWHNSTGRFPKVKQGKSQHFIVVSTWLPAILSLFQPVVNKRVTFNGSWASAGSCHGETHHFLMFCQNQIVAAAEIWAAWHDLVKCDTATQRGHASSSHVYGRSKEQTDIVGRTTGRGPSSVFTLRLFFGAIKSDVCLSCWSHWGCTSLSVDPLPMKKCHWT